MPFLAKFFGRQGTRSKYGKTPERNVPAVKEEETEIVEQQEEAEKKQKEAKDSEIEESQDKKKVEGSGATTKIFGKKIVKKNIASNREGTSTAAPGNMFNRFWATVLTHSMSAAVYTDRVTFMPNAIPLFVISEIYFRMVAQSNWVSKHEITFNPYAAFVAVCYLYYIQILRAKEAAGALVGNETSILTRFRKAFPEEKIIIPGVFVPYFESIVATEPSDNKYPWIVPHYGDLSTFTNFNNYHAFAAGQDNMHANFMRPLMPLLLANLASFGAIAENQINNHIDESGIYRAIDLHPAAGANAVHALNQDFNMTAGQAMTGPKTVFMMGGLSVPFQFHNDNVPYVHRHMRRTNFYGEEGIDYSIINGQTFNGEALAQTRDLHTLETFLSIQKSKNAHWADYIFTNLATAAKHSQDNKNLSEIATTGGMESTIFCSLRTGTSRQIGGAGANRYVYADTHLGLANSDGLDWYTNRLRNMTGSFKTARADVEREEELQAFVFGINSTMPIAGSTRNVTGSLFTHATNAGGNADAMLYSEHGIENDTVPGPVTMYEGWEHNIIRPAFLAKPIGA